MMRFLFVGLPGLLFEPIAAGAILGAAVSFLVFRKKPERFYWILTSAISFLLFWRLSAHSLMLSSRYAAILLYPSIIFTVWFCFHSELLCKRFLQSLAADGTKYAEIARRLSYLPFLLMFGLSIACIAKSLRYNPYASIPIKISQAFSEDSKGSENIYYYFINCKEQRRILHYAKLKWSGQQHLHDKIIPTQQLLQKALQDNYNVPGRHYFFVTKEKQEVDFFPAKEILENGNFMEVSRYFTSRKKKQELILYRYDPFCRNIQEWQGDIPDLSAQNICRNGDFEQAITGKEWEERMAYYRKKKVQDFYLEPGRLLPQDWGLWLYTDQNFLQKMEMDSKQPVAGKYSFAMNGYCGVSQVAMKKQDCTYSGFIRGVTKSMVTVSIYYGDLAINELDRLKYIRFFVSPEHTYRFTIPVVQEDVPKKYDWIWLAVQSDGHVLLDQVECIPEDHLKK